MHIPYDPSKVSFEIIRLKSINASGGFITKIIENVHPEKSQKLACPGAIVNMFAKTYKIGYTYAIPIIVCVAIYEGEVIAIERAPFNSTSVITEDNELIDWVPNMYRAIEKANEMLNDRYEWFFDGSYIYSFMADMTTAIEVGKHLTEDGSFRAIKCKAVFINYVGFIDDIYVEDRQCLSFRTEDSFSISLPIWKSVSLIGESNMKKNSIDDTLKLNTQFDKVDSLMMVNLQFAIAAGISLSRTFGYQSIEPLQLPRLMIQLRTVNLQSIPPGTRQTFDIGLTFTQAMAWLLGINATKVTNYQEMLVMKRLFRYLSTSGIYSRFVVKNIMKEDVADIPLMNVADLMSMFDSQPVEQTHTVDGEFRDVE